MAADYIKTADDIDDIDRGWDLDSLLALLVALELWSPVLHCFKLLLARDVVSLAPYRATVPGGDCF
jgi:hypothetical protein